MANRLNWQIISSAQNITSYNIYRSIIGVESANDQPFALSDGMNLTLKIDDRAVQNIIFNTGDFANIGAATALEVATKITNSITGGISHRGITNSVYIRSNNTTGSIQIMGGTANSIFGFSTIRIYSKSLWIKLDTVTAVPGVMEYIDNDGGIHDWYRITAVDNLLNESAPTLEKQAGTIRDPVCIIFGTLQDANGYRIPDKQVIAYVEYPPTINGKTQTWVIKEPISTLTMRDGTFELELLQGASYRVDIPSIDFSRIVKIPEASSANLFSLDFEHKDMEDGGNLLSY